MAFPPMCCVRVRWKRGELDAGGRKQCALASDSLSCWQLLREEDSEGTGEISRAALLRIIKGALALQLYNPKRPTRNPETLNP
eukprot:530992-Rhodomonas_salina.2